MQRKRDRQRAERALIEAATAVFAERGFHAATASEVAERAGYTQGLINHHFGSKRGLLLAVLENKTEEAFTHFSSGLAEGETPQDEIRNMVLWGLDVYWRWKDLWRVWFSQLVIDSELGNLVAHGSHEKLLDAMHKRLLHQQARGNIRPDVDLRTVARALSALTFALGFMEQIVWGEDRDDVRRTALRIVDMLGRSIATDASPEVHDRDSSRPTRLAPVKESLPS